MAGRRVVTPGPNPIRDPFTVDRTVPLPLSFLWSLFCCDTLQLQSTPLAFTSVFPPQ